MNRVYVVSFENLKTNELEVIAAAANLAAACDLCISQATRASAMRDVDCDFEITVFGNQNRISKTITVDGVFSVIDDTQNFAINIENVELHR